MKYASNLPEWQKDVVKFLSTHRKYRIFGWEFGPTLLDYLYRVKENKQPDYTKNGLIVTYSIVPVVALISFASTRRATVTAAATLGVMLFGVLITVAIDYQKTKRKNNGEEGYYLGLLEALDEAPKYWWWPWGKKIKDVEITEKEIERAIDYSSYSLISRLFYSLFTNVALHQLCIARYGYFYNYQELTEEKMPNISVPQPIKDGYKKVCNAVGDGLSKATGSLISSTIKNEEVADKLEARSSNLIRKIFNLGDESTATLKKALESLEIEWLPLHLDKSLEGVRAGTKTIEDHNKYFSEQVREIVKLSLTYHPDKQEQNVNTNAEQGLINNIAKALRNIHDYVTKDKGMLEQRVVYRLFEDAPIKNIIDRDAFVVANIVAKSELSSIAFWEGERLMRGRNEYLRSARNCLKVLSELPESRNIIDNVRSAFDESYDKYGNLYQEKWIKNLEELSKECIEVKELEIVKGEVDMLLKESKEQCEILRKRSQVEGKADKMFIQPILEYCALMNIYFAFFNVAGEKDMRECSKERDSISEEEKQEIEKLSRQELLKSARDTCSELASKLTKNKKGNQEGRESRIKELGKVLFKLECAIKLLGEEFKVKETLMEREEKRIEAEKKEREQKLRELKERRERDVQLRQEAEQKAEQEAEKAEREAQARQEAEQRAEQALVGQAASFMRIAESSSDKNKMIIYQARVRILKDLLMLYRETNSRGSLCLSDDKVYQAREEVYTIHEEMHELVKEIGRDVVLNSITRAEDLVKKSGTIMLNLKKYKLGEEDYKRLEQEVNNLIEQEAQRAEQEAQARQSAEQKTKQLEQALERKNLEKVAIRSCSRKLGKLDDELQDAINEESESKIVEAAVGCARGSPEQVIDAIIEEIKINREQIIREGKVGVGVIEAGIRSFSNQGTSLSDVNVSHGTSAGMGRDSGAGI